MRKSDTPTYRVWAAAKGRCISKTHKQYPDYGGRGITMCESWKNDFDAFHMWMGDKPPGKSLDRIDNNGNYEPGNCRWATGKEQCRNQRRNRLLTINGVTKCLADWAEETGINPTSLSGRLRKGWEVGEAVYGPRREIASYIFDGALMTSSEIAKVAGISYGAFCIRLRRGWSVEQAAGRVKPPEKRKPVTRTHCAKGHEFSHENTYFSRCGKRRCKQCSADRYKLKSGEILAKMKIAYYANRTIIERKEAEEGSKPPRQHPNTSKKGSKI